MESADRTTDDGSLVGVVGDDGETVARLEGALDEDDRRASSVTAGSAADVLSADPSFVVAVGEVALSSLARTGAAVPVLPVAVDAGIESVPERRLEDAVDAVLEDEATTRDRPLLTVEGDGLDSARALFDATLVTDEPARISEYSLRSRERTVAQFRADGVVVATAAGSHGYASAAGGPLVAAAVDAVAVIPVGPFVTQTRQWILPDDDLVLTVERDEGDVSLLADESTVGTVSPGAAVSIRSDGSLTLLVTPASTDPDA